MLSHLLLFLRTRNALIFFCNTLVLSILIGWNFQTANQNPLKWPDHKIILKNSSKDWLQTPVWFRSPFHLPSRLSAPAGPSRTRNCFDALTSWVTVGAAWSQRCFQTLKSDGHFKESAHPGTDQLKFYSTSKALIVQWFNLRMVPSYSSGFKSWLGTLVIYALDFSIIIIANFFGANSEVPLVVGNNLD